VLTYVPRIQGNNALQVDQQTIADFVDGRLPQTRLNDVRQRIEADTGTLKAALHYAAHSESVPMPDSAPRAHTGKTPGALFDGIKQFFQWRAPVWISAPVAAVLIAAVIFTVVPVEHGPSVVAYQDKPYLIWQTQPFDSRPGVGFFHNAGQKREPAKAMTFSLRSNNLHVGWEAVPGALSYRLRISYRDQDGDKQTKTLRTDGLTAVVDDFPVRHGRRHEWELSGKTQDGRYFQMQGGFVLAVE